VIQGGGRRNVGFSFKNKNFALISKLTQGALVSSMFMGKTMLVGKLLLASCFCSDCLSKLIDILM
jgi:hypothetical protein